MRRPRFSPVMLSALLCLLLTYASNQAFGVEVLSVACGPASPNGHLCSSVPVKVSMLSGSPDYVDITYSAVDSNGVSLPCSPPSDFHEQVSRTHPFTDNIQVTATTNTVFPVQFTAYATGESAGGDNESGSCTIKASDVGSFAGPKTVTKDPAQPTAVGTLIHQIAPMPTTMTTSNKLESPTLGTNYTNDSLPCFPAQSGVSVAVPLVARDKAVINSVPSDPAATFVKIRESGKSTNPRSAAIPRRPSVEVPVNIPVSPALPTRHLAPAEGDGPASSAIADLASLPRSGQLTSVLPD
jgi:hypothetical protein